MNIHRLLVNGQPFEIRTERNMVVDFDRNGGSITITHCPDTPATLRKTRPFLVPRQPGETVAALPLAS